MQRRPHPTGEEVPVLTPTIDGGSDPGGLCFEVHGSGRRLDARRHG